MKADADFLIIGSGISGLSFALKIAEEFPEKQIILSTKNDVLECNTRYAQGGIAGVTNHKGDSFIDHILDTLVAGDHANDPAIVEMVVKGAPERIYELIRWGVSFDKEEDGHFNLALEGGHSSKRILHCKDMTGMEIQKSLIKKIVTKKNIRIISHLFAKDLIILDEESCHGAYFIDCLTGEEKIVCADVTFLATGGAGQVYRNTTNPEVATGDGIAMAYRAGAIIDNMEFIQFHPTALYNPSDNPAFLISEAVRGMGAILRDIHGHTFMEKYSPQASLAPRDLVARAIYNEMVQTKTDHVLLDCTQTPVIQFKQHFPNIYAKCCSLQIDTRINMIPVAPAAHYICGGIRTDRWGRTSIKNLYAGGECASTGLHGANRLASNSLLEALVFSHQAFVYITTQKDPVRKKNKSLPVSHSCNPDILSEKTLHLFKYRIKKIMSDKVSIVRTYDSLSRAWLELIKLEKQLPEYTGNDYKACELKNLLTVAKLIVQHSIQRKQNIGLYYNKDLAGQNEAAESISAMNKKI